MPPQVQVVSKLVRAETRGFHELFKEYTTTVAQYLTLGYREVYFPQQGDVMIGKIGSIVYQYVASLIKLPRCSRVTLASHNCFFKAMQG